MDDMKDMTKVAKTVGPYEQLWRNWCHELDRVVVTPIQQGGKPEYGAMVRLFSRFGEWETLKDEMDTCMNDESYYKTLYEDLEGKVENVRDEIREISDELEAIDDIGDDADTDEEGNYIISQMVVKDLNADIATAVKMLDKLYDKCDI